MNKARKDNEIEKCYVLIACIEPPKKELILASGIILRPLTSQLSIFDLASAGSAGFREWAVIDPISSVCQCEIESNIVKRGKKGYDTLNRAWLALVLLCLRGFSSSIGIASCNYSWNIIAGFKNRVLQQQKESEKSNNNLSLPKFIGRLLDYRLNIISDKSYRLDSPNEEDEQWIKKYFEIFNQMASNNPAFDFALRVVVDWRFSKDPRSALSRIWSGIEAIINVSSELVFRTSIIAASLLEERGEKRRERANKIKKLYEVRSKAVHGDPIDDNELVSGMKESFDLLKELLIVNIQAGHKFTKEDFEKAIYY